MDDGLKQLTATEPVEQPAQSQEEFFLAQLEAAIISQSTKYNRDAQNTLFHIVVSRVTDAKKAPYIDFRNSAPYLSKLYDTLRAEVASETQQQKDIRELLELIPPEIKANGLFAPELDRVYAIESIWQDFYSKGQQVGKGEDAHRTICQMENVENGSPFDKKLKRALDNRKSILESPLTDAEGNIIMGIDDFIAGHSFEDIAFAMAFRTHPNKRIAPSFQELEFLKQATRLALFQDINTPGFDERLRTLEKEQRGKNRPDKTLELLAKVDQIARLYDHVKWEPTNDGDYAVMIKRACLILNIPLPDIPRATQLMKIPRPQREELLKLDKNIDILEIIARRPIIFEHITATDTRDEKEERFQEFLYRELASTAEAGIRDYRRTKRGNKAEGKISYTEIDNVITNEIRKLYPPETRDRAREWAVRLIRIQEEIEAKPTIEVIYDAENGTETVIEVRKHEPIMTLAILGNQDSRKNRNRITEELLNNEIYRGNLNRESTQILERVYEDSYDIPPRVIIESPERVKVEPILRKERTLNPRAQELLDNLLNDKLGRLRDNYKELTPDEARGETPPLATTARGVLENSRALPPGSIDKLFPIILRNQIKGNFELAAAMNWQEALEDYLFNLHSTRTSIDKIGNNRLIVENLHDQLQAEQLTPHIDATLQTALRDYRRVLGTVENPPSSMRPRLEPAIILADQWKDAVMVLDGTDAERRRRAYDILRSEMRDLYSVTHVEKDPTFNDIQMLTRHLILDDTALYKNHNLAQTRFLDDGITTAVDIQDSATTLIDRYDLTVADIELLMLARNEYNRGLPIQDANIFLEATKLAAEKEKSRLATDEMQTLAEKMRNAPKYRPLSEIYAIASSAENLVGQITGWPIDQDLAQIMTFRVANLTNHSFSEADERRVHRLIMHKPNESSIRAQHSRDNNETISIFAELIKENLTNRPINTNGETRNSGREYLNEQEIADEIRIQAKLNKPEAARIIDQIEAREIIEGGIAVYQRASRVIEREQLRILAEIREKHFTSQEQNSEPLFQILHSELISKETAIEEFRKAVDELSGADRPRNINSINEICNRLLANQISRDIEDPNLAMELERVGQIINTMQPLWTRSEPTISQVRARVASNLNLPENSDEIRPLLIGGIIEAIRMNLVNGNRPIANLLISLLETDSKIEVAGTIGELYPVSKKQALQDLKSTIEGRSEAPANGSGRIARLKSIIQQSARNIGIVTDDSTIVTEERIARSAEIIPMNTLVDIPTDEQIARRFNSRTTNGARIVRAMSTLLNDASNIENVINQRLVGNLGGYAELNPEDQNNLRNAIIIEAINELLQERLELQTNDIRYEQITQRLRNLYGILENNIQI